MLPMDHLGGRDAESQRSNNQRAGNLQGWCILQGFSKPSYQKGTVASCFDNHAPQYGLNGFNNSQVARGIPDVSENGIIMSDGKLALPYGTSGEHSTAIDRHIIPVVDGLDCTTSAPVFTSVINLLNEKMVKTSKDPVGFINAALYANPQVWNDVTNGNNPGCGTRGFSCGHSKTGIL